MASAQETRQLFLEQCRTKYSWASGATRGTPSAIQRHRRDLEVAFAEINGLMAAMHYQDQAEGSTAPAPSPSPLQASQEYNYPIQISDDLLEDMPGTYKPPAEPSITVDDQPMAPQWGAIRSLREESEFHHRRFQALARRLGDPIISELLDIYPDARSIRSKGTQLAKDVLEGFKPHKLSLVFAFTCFSYSISQHFYKKGHINKSDILADIRTWRDLIADPKERQAFNRLAPELWPETKEYLHFIEIPVNPERRNFHLSNFQPEILPQATGQTTIDRSGPLYISDQYPFGTMAPNPDPKDGLSFSHDIIDLMKISHEVYDFSALALSSGQSQYLQTADAVWSQPTSTNAPVPPIFPPEPPSKFDSPDWGGEGPQLANQPAEEVKLEETVMFLVVLAFLQDIGELLYILSGKSLASRRYKLYPAQQGDQEAFYRKAQEAFFKPCSQHRSSASPASRALVSVAEMFTQGGYLRSIAEIKHYLVGVAAVSPSIPLLFLLS